MEQSITVLGLGNLLLMDEGIGVHAVTVLQERYTFSPAVELVDGGTSGLDLLPYIDKRDKVLILDAVEFGKEPGFIGMIENEVIPAFLQAKLSLHHMGLADVLSVANMTDSMPKEICLIGVQPWTIDVGIDLTPQMCDKMEVLLDRALDKLRAWGITCALQSPQKSFP